MTLALAWAALRRHALVVSPAWAALVRLALLVLLALAALLAALMRLALLVSSTALRFSSWARQFLAMSGASALVTLVLACQAVRRHPVSGVCTALLLVVSASLTGAPVPLALLLWVSAALVSLATWRALEPVVLRRLGCRSPGHLERERLDPALGADTVKVLVLVGARPWLARGVEVLVVDAPQPWLARGVRTLVVSRALLDLLEDRALAGLLAQAAAQVRAASLPGELVVWLGNLPLLGAWWLSRGVLQLGRVLAIVVGTSLVLPMVFWPDGFTRWAGRLLGTVCVGLLGSAMLSSGLAAAGLGLLLAWAVVPGLEALLKWEARRAETAADDVTYAAGHGWELLEALETLTWAESVQLPAPPLGWLCRAATPLADRADRIWRKLAQS